MLNSLRDRLSRGLQQSPAPVAAYEDEDEHEPERRQANPKRVIHHIESSIERVTQFGEFLVTNLRNKLEAADLDENAGRGEGGEAEAEQPKSVKVYGAGTLPAGLEDLRRSDLFAKESVGESRRRDGEAGRKNSAAGAEEGWEDVSDQTSQGSAARSAGQDELEVAWKPTFHDMSLLGVRKEIRSMWETSYASGKAIIHETMQEMVQGQQAGAGVKGLQREVYIKERNGAAEAFFSALGQQPISVVQLRRAGFFGVPDDKTDLRSRYWKITLGYLPPDKGKWMEILHQSRTSFHNFYSEFSQDLVAVGKDSSEWQDCESPTATGRQDDAVKKSQLASKNLMDEINKDTKRTWPDLHFFRENFGTLSETELKAQKEGDMVQGGHQKAISRILYTFGRLNPGIRYVQGMNELLAPIYYVFKLDPTADFSQEAEADAFWCFSSLMISLRDVYDSEQDDFEQGIHASLERFRRLLAALDRELEIHLSSQGVTPPLYGLRWITLLFSQEFRLPDVLRLWDSILAQEDELRMPFVLHLCCAMVIRIRADLLQEEDFAENLQRLQQYPRDFDIEDLIYEAKRLEGLSGAMQIEV